MNKIGLTNFASRYWNPDVPGTTRIGMTVDELLKQANEAGFFLSPEAKLLRSVFGEEGYDSGRVRKVTMINTSPTRAGIAEITDDNRHLLVTGYKARTPKELPVLGRWFEGLEAPVASYLNIVLYSREQLQLEADKSGSGDTIEEPWGIVAINAEVSSDGAPIPPTTMLRNALGMEYGGNGKPLDEDEYLRSVAFWSQHATVK